LLNGHRTRRLPNTANLALVPGGGGGQSQLAAADLAASTGSACHDATSTPSPVLRAMGLAEERARSAVRFSLGRWTTPTDIEQAADHLVAAATSAIPRR
jgi:cysteine desulfurase